MKSFKKRRHPMVACLYWNHEVLKNTDSQFGQPSYTWLVQAFSIASELLYLNSKPIPICVRAFYEITRVVVWKITNRSEWCVHRLRCGGRGELEVKVYNSSRTSKMRLYTRSYLAHLALQIHPCIILGLCWDCLWTCLCGGHIPRLVLAIHVLWDWQFLCAYRHEQYKQFEALNLAIDLCVAPVLRLCLPGPPSVVTG